MIALIERSFRPMLIETIKSDQLGDKVAIGNKYT